MQVQMHANSTYEIYRRTREASEGQMKREGVSCFISRKSVAIWEGMT